MQRITDGKSSWPELVGVDAFLAKSTIEKENSDLYVVVVYQRCPITLDYRPDRVRLFVDCSNVIISTPVTG
nr:proteinase inhibitor [Ipomoea trifida]GMD72030.1 ase inhibitor I13, potato inhibitor I [Ipomoea batatas]